MWFRSRIKRFKSKWGYLHNYFKTLGLANEIERVTDLAHCDKPVLILYGFGATRRSLSILETRLRQDGFGVFSLRLGGFLDLFNTAPIDQLARHVSKKIENLCERYKLPSMSIIGYSKGGLIGRYYVSFLGGNKRAHTLITLATPHGGNPWALAGCLLMGGFLSKGLRQMLPKSRFMRRLSREPLPKNMYAASIFSETDRISPGKYCSLTPSSGDAVHNISLPHLYHSDFVIKQSAYREIYKHLMAGLRNSGHA
ncbi:MAG: alpha/beta hydrolase [Deltaproteobacteria bacterium]|nr:alpha/beta hydrolase [Deltaproteobacteria bacterium]